jgi:hypothetical protein
MNDSGQAAHQGIREGVFFLLLEVGLYYRII